MTQILSNDLLYKYLGNSKSIKKKLAIY